MKAIVRRPSRRLGDGIVTHVERQTVDVELAFGQWDAYVEALRAGGCEIVEAPPADDSPDGVFVEDALVVHGDLAVVTRPGVDARRGETAGLDEFMAALGFRVKRISEPATLDGGDVLFVHGGLRVGVGARTNAAGAEQLAALTAVPVERLPIHGVLHLKTTLTVLPDGQPIDANVLALGAHTVLVAADSPRVAEQVVARGFDPVLVDISEFQKLEAGVTCLSVLARSTI